MFQSFVYEGTKLVAVGRGIADGGECSYLCDIAVLPSHQNTGLGKEPFYRKFGFLRMKTAMAIFENPEQQVERGYISETEY